MKLEDAIQSIATSVIQDGLCDAILLKGSMGRGDADEYSDIDMYLITSSELYDSVLKRRQTYLESYKKILFREENDFGILQMLAIYEDAVHVDLYTTTVEKMDHSDPIKVYYDPKGLFEHYEWHRDGLTNQQLVKVFNSALYYFVEGDSAYKRKNYPWAARIMDESISKATILLRSHYDKQYAFLGLKKINQILPREEYELIETAYGCMNKEEFLKAMKALVAMLDLFVSRCEEEIRVELNLEFFAWIKENVGKTLFNT